MTGRNIWYLEAYMAEKRRGGFERDDLSIGLDLVS